MPGELQVTVVVLCRNNPAALATTLDSVISQRLPSQVLVIDGSDDDGCEQVLITRQGDANLLYEHSKPKGPYIAMNRALALTVTPWLHFLHSGDRFFDAFSLSALVLHARRIQAEAGEAPAAVFGQALIEASGSAELRWLSPDPRMRRVSRWLRLMVPCHQAVLFSTPWAQQHPYDPRNVICADRPVMRQALGETGQVAYLPRPICRFRLDGVSSQLPSWAELRRRWREPGRTSQERLGELAKFLAQPLTGHYPLAMRVRSRLIGWLCR